MRRTEWLGDGCFMMHLQQRQREVRTCEASDAHQMKKISPSICAFAGATYIQGCDERDNKFAVNVDYCNYFFILHHWQNDL